MQLILVRHGIAEEYVPGTDDSKRELTEKGIKKIRNVAKGLKSLLPLKEILIISSPLKRASQTAGIIAAAFGINQISYSQLVSEGERDSIFRILDTARKDGILLITGHQPLLSEWSDILSGVRLPFGKGAAAMFELENIVPGEAKLLWFMQSKALETLDKSIV